MRRFTILSLMAVILALAVGLAALRSANDYWAGGLLMGVPFFCGVSLIAALCGKKRARASRLGFAILGGFYFALAFLGLSGDRLAKLPTSMLLNYVHERVAGIQQNVTFSFVTTAPTPGAPAPVPTVSGSTATATGLSTVLNYSSTPTIANVTSTGSNQIYTLVSNTATPGPPSTWQIILPAAANLEAFSTVGHCLFALIAGLIGAIIARQFEKRRIAVATPA
jgi:hypothetical protein